MVISLWGLDKREINHTGDGQADRKIRTDVSTVNIFKFIGLNAVNRGVTERWTLMTRVSHNVVH